MIRMTTTNEMRLAATAVPKTWRMTAIKTPTGVLTTQVTVKKALKTLMRMTRFSQSDASKVSY